MNHPTSEIERAAAVPSCRASSSAGRFLPAVGAAGILVACAMAIFHRAPETHTVTEAVRRVQEVALARGAAGRPDAALRESGSGRLGPWVISAGRVDPVSGELLDFELENGAMILVARAARVQVDTAQDSISFILTGVVFSRAAEDGAETGALAHAVERYVLGPVPYGHDIVPDALER